MNLLITGNVDEDPLALTHVAKLFLRYFFHIIGKLLTLIVLNLFDVLGLYFNNNSLKQATAYLEPFEKTGSRYSYPNGYQSYKYWAWDMVIKFGDESTYSTMANYFSRSNFRSVYGDVESLIESYSKLVKK